jgi:hypothetical protein
LQQRQEWSRAGSIRATSRYAPRSAPRGDRPACLDPTRLGRRIRSESATRHTRLQSPRPLSLGAGRSGTASFYTTICQIMKKQNQREVRDSNPHAPSGALISNEARQAVSGYLPCRSFQWTAGESNPDLLVASQASSRYYEPPFSLNSAKVRPGVEPGPPPYHRGVPPVTTADQTLCSHPGRTRTCDILLVRQASWPLDDGTRNKRIRSVAEVGVEPTSTSLSSWRLCRFAYSAESDCRSGSRTQGPGL